MGLYMRTEKRSIFHGGVLCGLILTLSAGFCRAQNTVTTLPPIPAKPAVPAPVAPGPAVNPAPAPPQVAPAPVSPVIDFSQRPEWPTNPQILRRTPLLDGSIQDSQWSPFYTVSSGPITGTVFLDWDDNYLYVGARTNQAASLVIDLDANDDGWLRGADNLELVVGSAGPNQKPVVTARLLDASSGKDAPVWTTQSLDISTILTAGRMINGTQEVTVAIPKDMANLSLHAGNRIGLRVDFLPPISPALYAPTAPYMPHLLLEADMVDAQAETVPGINPHLTLSDYRCIAGEKLFATLNLQNQTDQKVPLRYVLWEGVGSSASAVDTLKVVAPPDIPSKGELKLPYKTILPPDLVPGAYTLDVTAELPDGRKVESAASFTVVEAIRAQMASHPDPILVVGTTKLDLQITINSAVPDHFRGQLELTRYPAAWQLQGKPLRSVVVYGEDKTAITHVYFELPANTQAGDYPVEGRILWYGKTWNLKSIIHVSGNEAAMPASK